MVYNTRTEGIIKSSEYPNTKNLEKKVAPENPCSFKKMNSMTNYKLISKI